MTEYIDLDTPLELYVERGGFRKKQISTLRDLLDTNRIPYTVADVVERKRGKWIKDCNVAFFWKCSECGAYIFWRKEEYLLRNEDEPNYCPNCGADMRHSDD